MSNPNRAPKNRTEAENRAIRQKTDEMISEGYPTGQAQAIAFRMFRDGELSITEDRRTPEEIERERELRALRIKGLYNLFQLVKKNL